MGVPMKARLYCMVPLPEQSRSGTLLRFYLARATEDTRTRGSRDEISSEGIPDPVTRAQARDAGD